MLFVGFCHSRPHFIKCAEKMVLLIHLLFRPGNQSILIFIQNKLGQRTYILHKVLMQQSRICLFGESHGSHGLFNIAFFGIGLSEILEERNKLHAKLT